MIDSKTFKHILFGLIGGIAFNLPFLSWQNGYGWDWAYHFPIGWGGAGLSAMTTFFHELGHTLPAWFYGYPALPSFDFAYGGGMTWTFSGQMLPLIFIAYVILLYGLYYFKNHRSIQILIGFVLIFHALTAFNDIHETVINFMGPAAQILIGGFFLTRAWCDLAPRGAAERFLNSLIGWGMIVNALIDGWGLLHNDAARDHYYQQKGTHGFGDFDKIAQSLSTPFETVVWVWFLMAVAAVIVPFILYLTNFGHRRDY